VLVLLAKGLLKTNSLKAIISADGAGSMYAFPNQSGFSPVKLLVEAKELKRAQQIIAKTT
jgi:hypothetical protein